MSITTIQKPEKWNMKVYKGDAWPAESFQLVDGDGDAITTYTARMDIRRNALSAVVKTLADGDGFTVEGSKRTFNATVDLAAGVYYFDIEVTLPSGQVATPYAGLITVQQDVTYDS